MFRPEFQPPWTGQPCDDDGVGEARPARHGGNGRACRRECGRSRPRSWRRSPSAPTACRCSSRNSPRRCWSLARRRIGAVCNAASGIIGAGDLARLTDGAHRSTGTGGQGLAQAGAAIGREFGFGLLASVTDLPEAQLDEALNRLTNAGLLFVRGTPPESNYLFKHALVQDAAYGSLLRGRRQLLHGRIAATLEERFPEIVLAQPALFAQHCGEAGLAEKAVGYWLTAGQQALARSAMAEAAAQLRKGLDVLAGLPDGPGASKRNWTCKSRSDRHLRPPQAFRRRM